ncbi:hypothetical protein ACTXT7_001969 [Hymenolepis weldensis]
MSESADEYASNIRKLRLMGFGNDSEIKKALTSCENDIDCAITFLVNRNFEASSKTHETAIDEKQEITVSAVEDFPVDELKKLEDSLFVKKWNIPCLRSQALGLCFSSAIKIINTGGLSAFESTEPLQRFMSKCLTECLNKFLTSNAVLQWDAETLEGVHNMLELAVQLSVECLVVGKKTMSHNEQATLHADSQNLITLAFSYLKLIFNPECSYHQRCRDRTTNTGTYRLTKNSSFDKEIRCFKNKQFFKSDDSKNLCGKKTGKTCYSNSKAKIPTLKLGHLFVLI